MSQRMLLAVMMAWTLGGMMMLAIKLGQIGEQIARLGESCGRG